MHRQSIMLLAIKMPHKMLRLIFSLPPILFPIVDGNPLSYSAHLAGGGALPAWLSFDSATRTFSGTPANGDVGTLSIDVIANDGNGGTVTETFDVVVANANDAPTVVIAPTDYNAIEQVAINLHGTGISVADVDGDALTITLTGIHSNSNLAATVGTTGVVHCIGRQYQYPRSSAAQQHNSMIYLREITEARLLTGSRVIPRLRAIHSPSARATAASRAMIRRQLTSRQ